MLSGGASTGLIENYRVSLLLGTGKTDYKRLRDRLAAA